MPDAIDFSKLSKEVVSLNSALDSVGIRVGVATAAVVLGLLIEYAPDVWDFGKALVDAVREQTWSPLLRLEERIWFVLVGGVLITGGVFGELRYEDRARSLQGRLQEVNGQLVSSSYSEAAKANERAATLEAANLKQQETLAILNKEASDAKAEEQRVQVELATANQSVAEARRLADQERLKELALEEFLAPRVIGESVQGAKTSFDSLKPFTWASATIDFIEGDAEAKRLAGGIEVTLKMAGWHVKPAVPTSAENFDGVTITVRDESARAVDAAKALAHFLGGCRIDALVAAAPLPDLDNESIVVNVGLKPAPNRYDPLQKMNGGSNRWSKSSIDLPCH